jgi:hypothetical protein
MAWGNRGHDGLTLTATRLATAQFTDLRFNAPLIPKSEMMAHEANIPDIYWKSFPKDQRKVLDSAHYFDVDLVTKQVSFANVPKNLTDVVAAAKTLCLLKERAPEISCDDKSSIKDFMLALGSAPWRVEQIATKMQESFLKAKTFEGKPNSADDFNAAVDDALFYGGILSHYIGDLSQPMHVTDDYDGFAAKSGGLHGYFEDQVVNQLNFGFYDEVQKFAIKHQLAKKLISKDHPQSYSDYALSLAVNSYYSLDKLFRIDREYAIVKKSSDKDGLKLAAERKPAKDTAPYFRSLLIERFAYGADVLATIWFEAWKRGGSPDLTNFRSYDFRLKPEPIALDYLEQK